jgi:hypothetical protein
MLKIKLLFMCKGGKTETRQKQIPDISIVNKYLKISFILFSLYSFCPSHFKDGQSALQQTINGPFIVAGQKREIPQHYELRE